MKILAIDTATEACSVAFLNSLNKLDETMLVSDHGTTQAHKPNVDEISDGIFEICPQQHSQKILPMIDTVLRRNNTLPSELSAIAYGCGPGSFTGVRIAASTVQGLAFGASLDVTQVSTLACMAQQVFEQTGATEVLVLIDARMQEVYMGHFKVIKGLAVAQINESVLAPEDAFLYYNKLVGPIGIAGTGFLAYPELFSEAIASFALDVHYPNAKYMLPFAKDAINTNSCIRAEQIEPSYVRDTVTWQKLPHKM